MIPNILTTKEACKVLKMGRTKLSEIMNKDPTFPAIKDGKWFIFGDRLQDWLDRKRLDEDLERYKNIELEELK
ncbi:MAG: helix-turn-helix domain-containing protein [Eubacterium sp.]